MDWTQDTTADRKTYVLNADRRYMVEQWGLGSWTAWFVGYRIDPSDASLGCRADAQRYAEAHRDSAEQRVTRTMDFILRWGSDADPAWVIRSIAAIVAGREPDYAGRVPA